MTVLPRASLVPPLDTQDLRAICERMPQPVGVTGATGFVGSHLLDALLAGGASVRLLVRNTGKLPRDLPGSVAVVEGDLHDPSALGRFVEGLGTVLHVAGLVRAAHAEEFFVVNAFGTAQLVAAAEGQSRRPRFVYVSSLAAAGPSQSPRGRSPEEEPAPISAYGRSKLHGEQAVTGYRGEWIVLRPPAIYGPRDRDVFEFFRLAHQGWVFYPRGERYLTVAFVGDVVVAILLGAASELSGKTLHLGEPTPHSMRALLQTLVEAGGVRARLVALPGLFFWLAGAGGDGLHALGFRQIPMTTDKARELLAFHWTAETRASLETLGVPSPLPFRVGAELTWAWYRREGWL